MTSRTCLSAILFFIAHLQAFSAGESLKETRAELEKQLLGKDLVLRSAPNVAPTWYLTLGRTEYILKQKNSSLFPNPTDISGVKIKKIRDEIEKEVVSRVLRPDRGKLDQYDERTVDHRLWVFTLSHRHLGTGELQIERRDNLALTAAEVIDVLAYAFQGAPFKNPMRYRASPGSLLHFTGCGHDSTTNNFREFKTIDDGVKAGFHICDLCFNKRSNLSSYGQEMLIGKETEAHLRHYYRLVNDSALQTRVESTSKRILRQWPVPLKGYTYRFSILDNDTFNSFACAGGYIFITSGLLRSIENDDELEAVLAHEIAHVEQRHAIHEFLKLQENANAAAFIGMVATVAAGAAASTSRSPYAAPIASGAVGLTQILLATGVKLASVGYSKEHEQEADVYAVMYLESQRKSRGALLSALRKVRSSQDLRFSLTDDRNEQTHPDPDERIRIAEQLKCVPINQTFDAYNKEGELLYAVTIDAFCSYLQRDGSITHKALAQVEGSAGLGEARQLNTFFVKSDGRNYIFKADGKNVLQPMDRATIFSSLSTRGFDSSKPLDTVGFEDISASHVVSRAKN